MSRAHTEQASEPFLLLLAAADDCLIACSSSLRRCVRCSSVSRNSARAGHYYQTDTRARQAGREREREAVVVTTPLGCSLSHTGKLLNSQPTTQHRGSGGAARGGGDSTLQAIKTGACECIRVPYAAAAAAGAGSAEISTMKQKDERRKRDENRQMMVMRMHAVTCGTWPFFVMLMKLLEFSFSRSMLLSVCLCICHSC